MSKLTLDVAVYSSKRLPREELDFHDDPYESAHARTILQDLGIFFWRDDEHPLGIVLSKEHLHKEIFFCQFTIDKDTYMIDHWIDDDASEETWKFDDSDKTVEPENIDGLTRLNFKEPTKYNDSLSFIIFNETVVLRSIDSRTVVRYS